MKKKVTILELDADQLAFIQNLILERDRQIVTLRAELEQAKARIQELESERALMAKLIYEAYGPGYVWEKSK